MFCRDQYDDIDDDDDDDNEYEVFLCVLGHSERQTPDRRKRRDNWAVGP